MSKVILRPLDRNKWMGISRYKNCYVYLSPYLTRTGSIYTGLSVENAKRLGEALNLDLSPLSNYWSTYFIKVGNKEIYIDPANPKGELDYLFLKNHKRVAQSIDKILPSHDFVLVNEDEEAQVTNKYNKIKRQAFKEFDKLSANDRRKALRLYGFNTLSSSDEVIENKLNELVEKDPQKFIELWVENKNRDTEFIIKEAIVYKIINRNKNIYKYGEDIIGHSLEDTVAFLDNPVNQDIKITILKQLNKQ